MNMDRLQQEQIALRTLSELLEKAQECRALYERAGMSLPEPLRRLFGADDGRVERSGPSVKVPPLHRARRPKEADVDWVSIRVEEASPQSVVLAVLREAAGPMRAKEVVEKVQEVQPEVPSGSVANIGTRLSEGNTILRTQRGWELMSHEDAPVLFDGYLWAPASAFGAQEMAAFRREAILHLLGLTRVGLHATQLEEQLRHTDWLHAPVSKDLVKMDLKALAAEKKIRRRGNTRKWEAVPEE